MSFDMSQCKAGDKLVCRNGEIAKYVGESKDKNYPHIIKYRSGSVGCRTPNGYMYSHDKFFHDSDVIGFYKDEVVMKEPEMIERDKEYDLKLTGEELAWIWYFTGTTNGHIESKSKLLSKVHKMFKNKHSKIHIAYSYWKEDLAKYSDQIENWFNVIFTKPETQEERNKRELQEQYDATKKQLEELGKKLGVE